MNTTNTQQLPSIEEFKQQAKELKNHKTLINLDMLKMLLQKIMVIKTIGL